MNKRERAATFSNYVALELKGAIVSRGKTALAISEAIHRSPANFNRWLNGKVQLPLEVLCEAAEALDIDPTQIVENAYRRLLDEHGDRSTITHVADAARKRHLRAVEDDRFGIVPADLDDLDAVARATDPEPTDEQ